MPLSLHAYEKNAIERKIKLFQCRVGELKFSYDIFAEPDFLVLVSENSWFGRYYQRQKYCYLSYVTDLSNLKTERDTTK